MATEVTYTERQEYLNGIITHYQPIMKVQGGDYDIPLIAEEGKIKMEKIDKIEYFVNKCSIYELLNTLQVGENLQGNELERINFLLDSNKALEEKLGEGEYKTLVITSHNEFYNNIFENFNSTDDLAEMARELTPVQNDNDLMQDGYYPDEEEDFGPIDMDDTGISDEQMAEFEAMSKEQEMSQSEQNRLDEESSHMETEGEVQDFSGFEGEAPIVEAPVAETPLSNNEETPVEVRTETTDEETNEEDIQPTEADEIPQDLFEEVEEDTEEEAEEISIEIDDKLFDKTAQEDIEITLEEQEEFNRNRNFEEETLKDLQDIILKDKITLERVGEKYMEEYNERKEAGNLNQEEEKERMNDLSLFFYKVECDISDTKQKIQSKKDKEIYKSAKR